MRAPLRAAPALEAAPETGQSAMLRFEHADRLAVSSLDREGIRARLEGAAAGLRSVGVAVPPIRGKLLRPEIAVARVPHGLRTHLDDRFWVGALAIQMVHEASLLHDDIIDGAGERRGQETMVSAVGTGAALVLGDHYLTGAYRAAAATGSGEFLRRFIVAVERTVAGEVRQARHVGSRLDPSMYQEIVVGKSGELFGVAAVLGPLLLGLEDIDARADLGRDIVAMYQRVDDLLDYCGHADTGKKPLQDYRQKKWTWPLDIAGVGDFGLSDEEVTRAFFARNERGVSAAATALEHLEGIRAELLGRAADLDGRSDRLGELLAAWCEGARDGVEAQPHTEAVLIRRVPSPGSPGPVSAEATVRRLAVELGGPAEWADYFGHHARTFSLAARLFPAEAARRVSGVYAYCRFTDDIVDEPFDGAARGVVAERIAAWRSLSLEAFEGRRTGVPLLDEVLAPAAQNGVDWRYPEALLDGVEMDLTIVRYRTWAGLERYTFGVAGAVGGWLSQMFGVHDPGTLERAHSLGHAMQLTNILRDVGEDLDRDRLYIPARLLAAHGVTEDELLAARHSTLPLPGGWAAALEELIGVADAYYEHAHPGFAELPTYFRRPVLAASAAYRGIHDEVRKNGYDNLRCRAHVSTRRKVWLALAGMFAARRSNP